MAMPTRFLIVLAATFTAPVLAACGGDDDGDAGGDAGHQDGGALDSAPEAAIDGGDSDADQDAAPTDPCPLSVATRALVSASVHDGALRTLATAMEMTEGPGPGSPVDFLGVLGLGRSGSAMRPAGFCDGVQMSAWSCRPLVESSLEICNQDGCAEPGLYFQRIYVTMPPPRPYEEEHALIYNGEARHWAYPLLRGRVEYNPNPRLEWRSDLRTDNRVEISTNLDVAVTVALDSDEQIDLSHRGQITATRVGAEVQGSLSLTFTGLPAGELAIEVERPAGGADAITLDGEPIGVVGEARTIIWSEDCAYR